MSARNKQRAFTLVELLVVISIIGMLTAILLPALNAARETGRRITCIHNQQELAKSIDLHALSKNPNRYPASFSQAPDGSAWPWLAGFMAQIDQPAADLLANNPDLSLAGNPAHQITIKRLICPGKSSPPIAGLSYVGNFGMVDALGGPNLYDAPQNGIFHNRYPAAGRVIVNMDQSYVTQHDGVANTILTSENLDVLRWTAGGSEFDQGMLWFDPASSPVPLNRQAGIGNTGNAYARPSSTHPGGFVVSMCDQSTRFIKDEIDYTVYVKLMTPYGPMAVPPSSATISDQELNP